MDIKQNENGRDLDLHHLRILDVLLKERSLTKAARVLDLTQPALSKILARLRTYFDDPLFVRVSQRMEPTPKALALATPVAAILDRMRALRSDHEVFDPKTSDRTFSFFMIDAAVTLLLPPLLAYLKTEAPHIQVHAVQCDIKQLDMWLESGLVQFAIGSFPSLTHGTRRQLLWKETCAVVVRSGHPRLSGTLDLPAFVNEKHALVSAAGTGHGYLSVERILDDAIPEKNIVCRVPMFAAAAYIVKHSDVVAVLPVTLAQAMADDLDLRLISPPLALPEIEIGQYWHERFHRDPGNQWMRSVIRKLLLR